MRTERSVEVITNPAKLWQSDIVSFIGKGSLEPRPKSLQGSDSATAPTTEGSGAVWKAQVGLKRECQDSRQSDTRGISGTQACSSGTPSRPTSRRQPLLRPHHLLLQSVRVATHPNRLRLRRNEDPSSASCAEPRVTQ